MPPKMKTEPNRPICDSCTNPMNLHMRLADGNKFRCRKCNQFKFLKSQPQPLSPEPPAGNPILEDLQKAKTAKEQRDLGKLYHQALTEIQLLQEKLGIHEGIQARELQSVIAPQRLSSHHATAILCASDWHVEERVDPQTVNGLNSYNLQVSEGRARNFFSNGLRLTNSQRGAVEITQLVLWLGGDLISGYLHEELLESNFLSPTQACLFVIEILHAGIDFLLKEGKFEKILVPCSFGNHGRTTAKPRHSTGYKNNLEWLVYHQLARAFAGDARVEFAIPNGYFNYVQVHNKLLRFHHGDNVRYAGGVGGLTIPLTKFIHRTNQQRRADMDVIGHYHTLFWGGDFICNGSLVGFNAYAQATGQKFERPQQAFFLVDQKWGFTIQAPICVEDPVKEKAA